MTKIKINYELSDISHKEADINNEIDYYNHFF